MLLPELAAFAATLDKGVPPQLVSELPTCEHGELYGREAAARAPRQEN